MISAIYPGSFDPLHLGHENIILRASKVCDVLYVAVLYNSNKKHLLTLEQRIDILNKKYAAFENIKIVSFSGLLLDFCLKEDITYIIKGLRNIQDFQVEMDMANGIKYIDYRVETLFIPCDLKYSFLSSSMVKDMYYTSKDISKFVSKEVCDFFER
ncbi:MAG: pantetheine-phosphate adenylyltransferase [Lachnospirales bacterium]